MDGLLHLAELVQHDRRLHVARKLRDRRNGLAGQIHHRLIRRALAAVQQNSQRLAFKRAPGLVLLHQALRGLDQVDGSNPDAVAEILFAPQDSYRLLEFGGIQRIEWMLRAAEPFVLRNLVLYFSWNCHVAAFALA